MLSPWPSNRAVESEGADAPPLTSPVDAWKPVDSS